MSARTHSHKDLIEHAALTERDMEQINLCGRSYNRLGFAYQIGFLHLKNRLLVQHPFEIISGLVTYTGIQLGIEPNEIQNYASRQQTISQHQVVSADI